MLIFRTSFGSREQHRAKHIVAAVGIGVVHRNQRALHVLERYVRDTREP